MGSARTSYLWLGSSARRLASGGTTGISVACGSSACLGGAVEDNANERDREQEGPGQAPVSRRSFVLGVAAAGAAVTAGRALPGRRAAGAADAGAGRAVVSALSTCGSFSLVT